jgi:hypothetical protein
MGVQAFLPLPVNGACDTALRLESVPMWSMHLSTVMPARVAASTPFLVRFS